jgi:hypothetical protein
MSIKLEEHEVEFLRTLLSQYVVKDRTGELGFMHGADRFVSTQLVLKKQHRNELKELYGKLGLANQPREVKK